MATYFDFKKKVPHVNKDDIFVKNGIVKDDQLVLEYSIGDLDPLSISLSSFDKMMYIDNAEFKDNNLIMKYNSPSIADLSISLSSLDKHVDNILMSDDKNVLSLCFNDGTFISADTSKYTENFYIKSWSVVGKNLVLKYNTCSLDPIVIDLEKITNKITSIKTNDNILIVNDELGNVASVDLEKFSYNDFIEDYEIDDANQLILKYTSDKASGNAKDLSIDLARFARNYYIKKANLCNEVIVLEYNSIDAGNNLSIDVAKINNYIKDAKIIDKTLVLSYNSDRLQPLSVNVADFIFDVNVVDDKLIFTFNNGMTKCISLSAFDKYITSGYVADDKLVLKTNKSNSTYTDISIDIKTITKDTYILNAELTGNTLKLKYNDNSKDAIEVDLTKLDDHIDSVVQNLENDTIVLNRVNGKVLDAINLAKYVNNDLSTMHIHGNALVLKFEDGSTKHVSLDKFDKYIDSYDSDDNNLYLFYNNNKGCLTIDKKYIAKNLSNVHIIDNICYFEFTDKSIPLTVDLNKFDKYISNGRIVGNNLELSYNNGDSAVLIDAIPLSTYVNNIELEANDKLKLSYNANNNPITVDLSRLNNELTNTYTTGSNLVLEFAHGKTRIIDLKDFNKHLTSIYLDENNNLKLIDNIGNIFNVSLSKLDKYVNLASIVDKTILYKYNDNTNAFSIAIDDINYNLTSGKVDADNNIVLSFSNGKDDIVIDAHKLNELTSGTVDDNNNIILSFANNKKDIIIDAAKLKTSDTYISSATLDPNDVLVFDYNTATPRALQVDLHKFDRNDYINAGHYDSAALMLILDYRDQAGFGTKLPSLSIDLPRGSVTDTNYYVNSGRFDINSKNLILTYNTTALPNLNIGFNILSNLNFTATDNKSIFNIADTVEKIVTAFGGNRSSSAIFTANDTNNTVDNVVDNNQLFTANTDSDLNYYVNSGRFDINSKNLILTYNTTALPNLNIGFNILSNLNFTATDNKSIFNIADTVEKIVTAFGGNR